MLIEYVKGFHLKDMVSTLKVEMGVSGDVQDAWAGHRQQLKELKGNSKMFRQLSRRGHSGSQSHNDCSQQL